MAIHRPCYVTREEARLALDIKQSAYDDRKIDRWIMSASRSVDGLCQRVFFSTFATRTFDWPNFQYTYPWKLYLDQNELAAAPTSVTSGSFLTSPVVIPLGDVLPRPINGPPFTYIELRRDHNSAFGNNTTPQADISITGPFGYWMEQDSAGSLAAAITDTTGTTVTISDSSLVGVGDVLICETERMLVTDARYVSTGISFLSGCTTAQANDITMAVPDGTKFSPQEIILVDSEWMLIQDVVGNNLIIKRAYAGAVLATHVPGPIFAKRQLTVNRGALGTTAATHSNSTALFIATVPDLVKDTAAAEFTVMATQMPAGYANTQQVSWHGQVQRGQGSQQEPFPGPGLPDLRARCLASFGRSSRSRAV
jgi:hypothetical protein